MLYVDWSAKNAGSAAGLIVVSPEGHSYKHALKLMFRTFNNEAEYETLLAGMEFYNARRAEYLKAFFDSQFVVSQVRVTMKLAIQLWSPTWLK